MILSIMSIFQLLLGILYLGFGLNGLFNILPDIGFPNIIALTFFTALENSGYVMQMFYIVATITGASLVLSLFSALFLLLFLPFIINFPLFYYFLGEQFFFSSEMLVPLIVCVIHLIIMLSKYQKYTELLRPR